MHPNLVGALINSALYLLCVFIAGIATAHPLAWKLALVTIGVAFFSHVLQAVKSRAADPVVVLSWLIGLAAGLALLF